MYVFYGGIKVPSNHMLSGIHKYIEMQSFLLRPGNKVIMSNVVIKFAITPQYNVT